jgi:CubicO group peptidase (beta-lactamase class C family)
MDSSFHAAAEAAAARWSVPALVAGELVDGHTNSLSVGCEPGTRFRIASITKPFTATLALKLLDLGATTGIWPEDVQIRHLLSHTSGYDSEHGDLARFGDGEDALAAACAELPSVRRFVGVSEVWSYANSGFWIAGLLAARAAGMTYEEAVAEHVLRPAGLETTAFDSPELAGTGPSSGDDGYPRARRPSGGLVSNVADLLTFARWQLAEPSLAALRVPLGKPVAGVYGLGMFGERVGGFDVWGHGGSYGGFESTFLLVPDRGAAFAGLTNSGRGAQALRELEDAWFERVIGARRRAPQPIELDPAILATFAGQYANSTTTATIAPVSGGLALDVVEGDEHLELFARPIGAKTFEILGGDEDGYRFDFPLDGFVRAGSRLAERVAPAR